MSSTEPIGQLPWWLLELAFHLRQVRRSLLPRLGPFQLCLFSRAQVSALVTGATINVTDQ